MARADRAALAVAATRKETRFPRWGLLIAAVADAVKDANADADTVAVSAVGRSVAV